MTNLINDINEYIIIKNNKISESSKLEDFKIMNSNDLIEIELLEDKDQSLQVIIYCEDENELQIKYTLNKNSSLRLIEKKVADQSKVKVDVKNILMTNSYLDKLALNECEDCKDVSLEELSMMYQDSKAHFNYGELSNSEVRANYHVNLLEEGSDAQIQLGAISEGSNKKYFDVELYHFAHHTNGLMNNYGVCKDNATLVFNGVGNITKGAYQSQTHQNSKILVFDEKSIGKTNPYLYIDENDVMASHAASVGKMDEDQLYYLQSRGLDLDQSKKLITFGYLMPIVKGIENESLKASIYELIEKKVG